MVVEGIGPYQIARILTEEKVERCIIVMRESVQEGTGEDCRMAVSEQLQPVITAAIIITAMTSQERSAVRTIYRQR